MTEPTSSPTDRSGASAFVVLMLLCLTGPAFLWGVSLLASDGPAADLRDLWSSATATDAGTEGGRHRGFEERLESRSPAVQWANRFYAPVIDEALKRGNARVVFGRRNWLFYRQAVDYVTGPALDSPRADRLLQTPGTLDDDGAPPPGDPATAILDFHRQLRSAGVELLVVPVPVKPTLYPERLWQGTDPESLPNNPGFGRLVADLETAGVQVLDLAPALLEAKRQGQHLFLPRDTHWTPEGMSLAAEVVSDAVRGLPLWPELEATAEPFDHRQVAFTGDGDLYEMLAYAPWRWRARPMRVMLTQVIADHQGQRPRAAESPILLLGDSLTGVFSSPELGLGQRGGLAEHLASQLGMPIDVIAMPAGGASRSRKALALRPDPLRGKRLVIWQLTQRDLMFAAEGWARVPLPPPSPETTETAEEAGQRFEVLAWLMKTTRLPPAMDYGDCLITSLFREVDSQLPTRGNLFTIGWGIRDWQPTEAASFQPEAFYRLVIEPLPPEIDLEHTCWLDTVGLSSRPWWIVEAQRQ